MTRGFPPWTGLPEAVVACLGAAKPVSVDPGDQLRDVCIAVLALLDVYLAEEAGVGLPVAPYVRRDGS
eukprot:scaffold43829_cov51-Prasinocladus_malaysianus.AAC.1